MKKCLALLLILGCMITLVACGSNNLKEDKVKLQPGEPTQFVGSIIEIYDKTFLIEVKDEYTSGIAVGTQAYINTALDGGIPECSVGDYILVKYDGTVKETYPLEIDSVTEILKIDKVGKVE